MLLKFFTRDIRVHAHCQKVLLAMLFERVRHPISRFCVNVYSTHLLDTGRGIVSIV